MPLRLTLALDDRVLRFPLPVLPEGEALELGSAEGSDLRVPHYTVSRRHARLRASGATVEIEDLGSRNGTLVDGRPLRGSATVSPGLPVAFGSVEGLVEEVPAVEVEPAVTFEAPRAPVSPTGGDPPTTFSAGALEAFTLNHLPGLLARLADGADRPTVTRALGTALFESLPCASVEVVRAGSGEDGVLFSAGRGEAAASPLRVAAGDLAVVVGFLHVNHRRAFAPLVEGAARLLEAAPEPPGGSRRAKPAPRPAAAPPPLPEPPTVVAELRGIYADAARVARGEVSVLVCGESGTGKEVLARYIHAASPRSDAGFVALNCAALPRDLLESELFGVEAGTATGVSARPGKFELAHGGTLFLDEVGDMAPETQAKILRVLQEGEVYRLGGQAARPARVRVVSATNQDVDALLARGVLRSDLYHRIADWRVELPTLRERREDVPNLAAHFLAREAARLGLAPTGISRGAVETLRSYDWPGNVRQLEREMARAALFLQDGELLETGHLQAAIRAGAAGRPPEGTLAEAVAAAERRAIRRALDAADGDTATAAEALGIARSTLYRKINELGIE